MSVVWKVKNWEELKKEELYEILRLRSEIFIVEQECPYQDLDNRDIFTAPRAIKVFKLNILNPLSWRIAAIIIVQNLPITIK